MKLPCVPYPSMLHIVVSLVVRGFMITDRLIAPAAIGLPRLTSMACAARKPSQQRSHNALHSISPLDVSL